MKRYLILLSVLALLLTGCAAPSPATDSPSPSESPSPPEVSIALSDADLTADPPTLTVTWYNSLDQTIYPTDRDYEIIHKGENGPETCFDSTHPYADAQFTLKSYEVAPHSTLTVTYDIAPYILPRGEELYFYGRHTVEDRRTVGIVSFCFTVTEDGRVEPVATDGLPYPYPFGYQISPETPQSPLFEPSTDERFYLTLDRQETKDGYTVLDITWHNESDIDAWFGEPYDIEYFDGEHWVSVITDLDAVWYMPAYSLPAHGTSQKTYTPDRYGLFDLSEAGRYRFSSDYTYTAEDDRNVSRVLTVEFTVD